ncbi:mitochondrial import protein Pam17-domain-containing protein [Podospora didyma]|uniref:Presequence translocated-associated motor subunit PAM17 n=1 Tax=Podospora didyma TaxID=330526 RepID=A0AAE0P5N7_9PEZI|nr:mitochondrial import protein Pam17-domain-containing protein [Podospora didyma]
MLTSTATSMIRTSARSGLQPILFRSAACPYAAGMTLSPFSMAAAAPSPSSKLASAHARSSNPSKQTQAVPQARPLSTSTSSSLLIRFRTTATQTQRRNASSSPNGPARVHGSDAEVDANAAAAAAAAQTAAHPEASALDWNTFFQLRKTRRRWQQAFSVVVALASSAGGALFLTTSLGDQVVGQIPLDPFITMGLVTLSFATLGWLVGPSMGTLVFNSLKRKYKGQMAIKESQFFARVKKHRVDPTASSMGNPVPDFYGEKISSVAGYRQWLRDQRAFNKKRTTFV